MNDPWLYEVTAEFQDGELAADWAAWMLQTHIADVITAGAKNGRLLRSEESPRTYIVQYEFSSRETLDHYLEEQSPRLRAQAAVRFDPARIKYSRRTFQVVSQM